MNKYLNKYYLHPKGNKISFMNITDKEILSSRNEYERSEC